MSGQMMNYKISLRNPLEPIMPSELPDVSIDYNGLLEFAKQRGVRVIELTEEERGRFVIPNKK